MELHSSINQSIKIFIELLGMKQIDYKASQYRKTKKNKGNR